MEKAEPSNEIEDMETTPTPSNSPSPVLTEPKMIDGATETIYETPFYVAGLIRNVTSTKDKSLNIDMVVKNDSKNAYFPACHVQCASISALHSVKSRKGYKSYQLYVTEEQKLTAVAPSIKYNNEITLLTLDEKGEGCLERVPATSQNLTGKYAILLVSPATSPKTIRKFKFTCYDVLVYATYELCMNTIEKILIGKKIPNCPAEEIYKNIDASKMTTKEQQDAIAGIELFRSKWTVAFLGLTPQAITLTEGSEDEKKENDKKQK